MTNITNFPVLIFVISLFGLWLAARIGALVRTRLHPISEDEREDFAVVLGATLTLLGLLIGFTFSMAISRYDQRKNYEEEEANAIGTEYLRADLLPSPHADSTHQLLTKYLEQRTLFYETMDQHQLARINIDTSRLQAELWSQIRAVTAVQDTPVATLAAAGMNDVINTQGYTQAAWWNRVPIAAWALMAAIAVCCNFLAGYSWRRSGRLIQVVIPVAISISFLLIADIDSPRGGLIRVYPKNLVSLSESLRGHEIACAH